jgi:hypothetical protein
MAAESVAVPGRRWYQRSWVWLTFAAIATPTLAVFLLIVMVVVQQLLGLEELRVFWLVLPPLLGAICLPVGLLMAAFVARRAWARGVLVGLAVLVVAVTTSWVWRSLFRAADAPLSDRLWFGALFALSWGVPLLVLTSFRNRFRPDDLPPGEYETGGRVWYHRGGVWAAIAGSLGLLGGIVAFMASLLVGDPAAVLIGFLTAGLVTAGLWLATLMAERRWTRIPLGVFAGLLLVLGLWGWYNFLQADEQDAFAGCEQVPVDFLAPFEPERVAALPPGTETAEIDPAQCARTFDNPQTIYPELLAQIDGPPPMHIVDFHRILWAVFIVLWLVPPVLLVLFRKRLKWNPRKEPK